MNKGIYCKPNRTIIEIRPSPSISFKKNYTVRTKQLQYFEISDISAFSLPFKMMLCPFPPEVSFSRERTTGRQ